MLDIIEVQNLINLFSYSISHFQLQQGFGNFSLCTLAVSLSHFAASSFSEMATFSSSITMAKNPQTQFLSGSVLKPTDQCFMKISSNELSLNSSVKGKVKLTACNMPLVVRAGGDDGRSNSGINFVGGFVLGGLIVGALGCVYAPQISKAIAGAGADSKDLMRKLPKFMYDEEKALEKTRKVLTEKIAQLNSAIDGVSAQLRADEDEAPDASSSAVMNSQAIEASM